MSVPRIERGAIAILLLLGLLPPVGHAAQPTDVTALMRLLAQVQRVEVEYTETVESGLIDTAISTKGRLVYEAPERIRRLSDKGRGFALDGDRMELIDRDRVVKVLQVSDIAPLKAMVGALRATFAGDLATLEADYALAYRTIDDQWTLTLRPRGLSLSGLYQRIEMLGSGATVTRIALEESGGDRRTLRMRLLSREPTGLDRE